MGAVISPWSVMYFKSVQAGAGRLHVQDFTGPLFSPPSRALDKWKMAPHQSVSPLSSILTLCQSRLCTPLLHWWPRRLTLGEPFDIFVRLVFLKDFLWWFIIKDVCLHWILRRFILMTSLGKIIYQIYLNVNITPPPPPTNTKSTNTKATNIKSVCELFCESIYPNKRID